MIRKARRNAGLFCFRGWWSVSAGGQGHAYQGCDEQAGTMAGALRNQSYDDNWNFEWVGEINFGFAHQYIRAISNNPNDPAVIIDPWKDKLRIDR